MSAAVVAHVGTDPVVPLLQSSAASPIVNPVTVSVRRKRGPSLSRRTGQKGSVFQKQPSVKNGEKIWNPSATAFGQFWIDTPEGRKHRSVQLGTFATRSRAERKLCEYIEEAGLNND